MEFRYQYDGAEYAVTLEPTAGGWMARISERGYEVHIERQADGELALIIGGRRIRALTASGKSGQRSVALLGREVSVFELARAEGRSQRRSTLSGQSDLSAPMPGLVRDVFVAQGQAVAEGQPLLLLEAMKMEIRVAAPLGGIVARLHVKAGDTVERGQALVEVTPGSIMSQGNEPKQT